MPIPIRLKRIPTPFEKELIDYIAFESCECGEDDVLIEVLCRKLYKHGLIEKEGNEWILEPIADTPQTDCAWK